MADNSCESRAPCPWNLSTFQKVFQKDSRCHNIPFNAKSQKSIGADDEPIRPLGDTTLYLGRVAYGLLPSSATDAAHIKKQQLWPSQCSRWLHFYNVLRWYGKYSTPCNERTGFFFRILLFSTRGTLLISRVLQVSRAKTFVPQSFNQVTHLCWVESINPTLWAFQIFPHRSTTLQAVTKLACKILPLVAIAKHRGTTLVIAFLIF